MFIKKKVCKIIGFAPSLLQIVVQNFIPEPVRQATVIQLKNFITRNWLEKDVDGNVGQMEFSIHEQDRTVVRNNIVESITQPEMLSNQKIHVHLATCIYHIIKCDFPGRWPQIVDKISVFLQNGDYNSRSGAILCLYQLVKNYEYKKADERGPLDEAMNILLPMIYNLMVNLMQSSEQTEECVLLQKNILKIYYTLIQVSGNIKEQRKLNSFVLGTLFKIRERKYGVVTLSHWRFFLLFHLCSSVCHSI